MKTSYKAGFSLIELLVALSILAVVAAIIVPRFLNVRQNAAVTTALAQLRQLQHTYAQFIALGGTGTTSSAELVQFLGVNPTTAGSPRTNPVSSGSMADSTGTFGSTTIALNINLAGTGAAPTSTSSVGFYTSGAAGATGTAYYADGAGHAWSIGCDTKGGITATATVGTLNIDGTTFSGTAAAMSL